jgi:hypothetical protein
MANRSSITKDLGILGNGCTAHTMNFLHQVEASGQLHKQAALTAKRHENTCYRKLGGSHSLSVRSPQNPEIEPPFLRRPAQRGI